MMNGLNIKLMPTSAFIAKCGISAMCGVTKMTTDKETPLYLIGYKPPEKQNFVGIWKL